jgi:hypothetical protein
MYHQRQDKRQQVHRGAGGFHLVDPKLNGLHLSSLAAEFEVANPQAR